jgi:large subunit ribosomal protein L5
MLLIKYHYQSIIKYDLINKFLYKNVTELPKLKKINLNFKCNNKNLNIKSLSVAMLSLELITNQKGKITKYKNTNLILKIRKGHPIGCKITLKKKIMHDFFFKLLVDIFPKIKNFHGIKIFATKRNTIFYKFKNTSIFPELEKQHNIFKNLSFLDITFVTNTKTKKEFLFLLDSHKLPLLI